MKRKTVGRMFAISVCGIAAGLMISSAASGKFYYPGSGTRPRNAYCTTDSKCGQRICFGLVCNCCYLGRANYVCCPSIRCDRCVVRSSGPRPIARPVPD